MKVFLAILLLALEATALPNRNRPVWKKATKPIDLSNIQSFNFRANSKNFFYAPHTEPVTPAYYKTAPRQQEVPCGIETKQNGKVVGGSAASEHQFPWLAVVNCVRSDPAIVPDLNGGGFLCTGSIIDDFAILTAGHCTYGCLEFDIYVGTHDRTLVGTPGDDTQVIEGIDGQGGTAFITPNYRPAVAVNDVSIIPLPDAVQFRDGIVSKACLPSRSMVGDSLVGQLTTVTGWGKPADNINSASNVPRFARNLPIISNAECAATYGISIQDTSVCIDTSDGRGVCNGDSGGPLNLQTDGPFIQVGVASFVHISGCESGLPHSFARVTEFLDFIEDRTGLTIF